MRGGVQSCTLPAGAPLEIQSVSSSTLLIHIPTTAKLVTLVPHQSVFTLKGIEPLRVSLRGSALLQGTLGLH